MLKNMGAEEIDLLKQILRNMKIPRHSNSHIVNRLMINGSYLEEAVIKPLEKMIGWTEYDEKNAIEIAKELELATQNGKTLKEKTKILKKELKIRGLIAKDRIRHIIKKLGNK